MDFLYTYLILAEIYVLLGLSTNLLVGVVGIFSVSQAAVFGVGAYIVADFLLAGTLGFVPAIIIAAIACIVLNVLITLPSLRVAGDYFVVTSFGIQLLATATFVNWTNGTGGANGLPGIPPPDIFGWQIADTRGFLALATVFAVIGCLGFFLLMRAPFGRLLRAIREDELAVAAAGKGVLRAKVEAAALAGAFGGIAGGLYATFLSFIDPFSFDLDASILLLTMIVVGGARTLGGSILGPFLLLALPQALSLIAIPNALAAPLRQLIYGALLIAFALFRPQGLLGERLSYYIFVTRKLLADRGCGSNRFRVELIARDVGPDIPSTKSRKRRLRYGKPLSTAAPRQKHPRAAERLASRCATIAVPISFFSATASRLPSHSGYNKSCP